MPGIKQTIDETIAFHSERQELERRALDKVNITQANAVEIMEVILTGNHEAKMNVFGKYIAKP